MTWIHRALIACLLVLTGCTSLPEGVKPVSLFELDRYLGTWYEIARLNHRFEQGLSQVTAEYSKRGDGGIRVVNRGFDAEKGEWREAIGKAYPIGAPGEGRLKVSFFGPFYGAYNIIALDRENYEYAMVCGPNRDYLWILARTPQLDQTILKALLVRAKGMGFDTQALLYPEPSRPPT